MARVNVFSNPKKRPSKRKKAKRRTTVAKRASAPAKRRRNPAKRPAKRRVARRRNPITGKGVVDKNLMPALKAAAGAIVLDGAYSFLPIPAEYQSGQMGALVKAGAVIGMGMLAERSKVMKPATVRDMVNGSLTVQLHALGQELVGGVMAGGAVTTTPTTDSGDGTAQGLGYAGTNRRAGVARGNLPRSVSGGMAGYDLSPGIAGYDMAPASY